MIALCPASSWATYPGANGRIAYIGSSRYDPQDDIYSVLPDGTSLRRLTSSDLNEYDPAWSANGRRLAFVRTVPGYDGGTQVFTMRADGSDKTQVTGAFASALRHQPSFSPSGRRIVYGVTPYLRPDRSRILKIRPDGAHRRRIIKGRVSYPAYSPSVLCPGGRPDRVLVLLT